MEQFTIGMAGMNIAVSAAFSSTKRFCRAYLTDENADFHTDLTQEDLRKQQERENLQARTVGAAEMHYSDAFLEMQILLRKIAETAPMYDSMFIHASALMVDGRAYLFAAKSGTGKSTHRHLWCELLGDRATVINDDKPFLHRKGDMFYVCGSPWRGKHNIGQNICAPLAGICFLSQAEKNRIYSLSPSDALMAAFSQCYKPEGREAVEHTLELLDKLLLTVPLYHLECNQDISAAKVCFEKMHGEHISSEKEIS